MPFEIRPIRPDNPRELELVAERMGTTLVEVLGEATGRDMYSPEWLLQRVAWHLDPTCCHGAIFVATDSNLLIGHTIVRVDSDENGESLGLFSTTYVIPGARRDGVADALLRRGEAWLLEQGMTTMATHTSTENTALLRLYEKHGYKIVLEVPHDNMLRLAKTISPTDLHSAHPQ